MQRFDEVMFYLEEFIGGDDGRRMGGRAGGLSRLTGGAHQGSLGRGRQRRACLGLASVGQIKTHAGYDAAVSDFTTSRVFHDVDAELNDVARTYLSWWALFRAFAQPLVVHESAITAFRVLIGEE